MHVRLGSFSQEKHLRSRMHLVWWQYNWDIEEIFWSYFFPLGFSRFLNIQPQTRSASSFFWNEDQCCNSNTVIAFQRVQNAAKSKGLEFILKAIMKTSHSLIPSFLFFGFYSQPKKGRELGSHPVNVNKVKCMTVTFRIYWDESLRSVRSDAFYSVFILNACRFKVMSLPGTVWHGKYSDPTLRSSIPAAMTEFSER